MGKTYRVCLIGCGRMGATIDDEVKNHPHSELWLPYSHGAGYKAVKSTELVAVSDVMADKVEAIKKRYEVPGGYTDYKEMIIKEKPDIVSIATRPGPHAEMTIFAAENGVKGIYCEKPLCCSMKEADAMVAACEKYGVKFNYGTQRRYSNVYHKIRELIQAGEIGNVQCVIAECGSGAAQWTHTHTSDMIMFLAGDPEVEFVQGTVSAKEEDWQGDVLNEDPGITCGYIRFKNGVHGYIVAGGPYEFEVVGSKGRIRTLNNGIGGQLWKAQGQWNTQVEEPFPDIQISSGTVKCIEDLVDAIEKDRQTQGGIQLARQSQEIIIGIVESHRYNGVRVTLPMKNRETYVGRKDW
ncbi:Gfo/Idh/MocA family oxidoreductase [Candidatus Poribacteria bacterium]|nr:Gfo/Idh/MocA family oxidoreductase [Candidatus Poribacteria bacterium]